MPPAWKLQSVLANNATRREWASTTPDRRWLKRHRGQDPSHGPVARRKAAGPTSRHSPGLFNFQNSLAVQHIHQAQAPAQPRTIQQPSSLEPEVRPYHQQSREEQAKTPVTCYHCQQSPADLRPVGSPRACHRLLQAPYRLHDAHRPLFIRKCVP